MYKFIICDDKKILMTGNYLYNAFKTVMKKCKITKDRRLLYLTINNDKLNDVGPYHSIYEYSTKTKGWKIKHDHDNINDVLTHSSILLDTSWSEEHNPKHAKVKDEIIEWCKKNNNSYNKVYVYTTVCPQDAKVLIKELEQEGIKVESQYKSIYNRPSLDMEQDFVRIFEFIVDNLMGKQEEEEEEKKENQ